MFVKMGFKVGVVAGPGADSLASVGGSPGKVKGDVE